MRAYQRQIPHLLRAPEDSPPAPFESVAAADVQPGMSLQQVVTIVRSYWKQTVIIAASVTVVMGLLIKVLPKTYTAIATLIVNVDNKDPLAGQQFPVDVVGNYVATQVELMTSPVVLLPVVDRLNLATDRNFTAGFRGGDDQALHDYIVRNLASQVEIEPGRGGQLLYVSGSARSPTQAADIANAVSDVYLDEERRRVNDPAVERAERYSQELAELRAKAAEAQEKVTEFRQHSGLTDLTSSPTDSETLGLSTIESRLVDAQNQRRALEARQPGQESTADEALASTQIGNLKTQLSTLQAQLADLSSTLGPRHPKVVELQSQIAATQKSLNHEYAVLSENNATQLARARDLENRLTQAVADQRAKVLKLHATQDQGEKLELELESAQSVYKRALDGYDQIMFASVGHYTNVSFISRATVPLKPSKPNKIKLLFASAFAGLLLGLGGPMLYEFLINRRLRCRDDIERAFGIPVLAQFDPIPPPASRI